MLKSSRVVASVLLFSLLATGALFATGGLFATGALAAPLGSAFTYQGQLASGGTLVDGTADLRFRLYDDAVAGIQIGSQVAQAAVAVSGGIFTVELDFGVPAFDGDARWLEIDVRSPTGNGSFETLSPRQRLTPAPYSLQTRGIYVDSANRVGIGTTSPSTPLHVVGSVGTMMLLESSDAAAARLKISNTATGGRSYDLVATADGSGVGGGKFLIRDGSTTEVRLQIDASGHVGIGAAPSLTNRLNVGGNVECSVLQINGGSDIAEPFTIASHQEILPGMVVSIDPERPAGLRLATEAYDRTVAGVVSGAGGVNPGMMLRQAGTQADGTHPVALTGRVYCYVDADAAGPVKPGDLLTTSDTPGHAMRVDDPARAGGAILGKAMTALDSGRGLVLVLVSLQ